MINTRNDFFFGIGNKILSPGVPIQIKTRQQAYRTAAWIYFLASFLPEEDPASSFEEIRKEISMT